MDEKSENNGVKKKIMSPCDVEALKKCLEENKGDYVKCQSHIEAFKSSCSLKKPPNLPSQSSLLKTEPRKSTDAYPWTDETLHSNLKHPSRVCWHIFIGRIDGHEFHYQNCKANRTCE